MKKLIVLLMCMFIVSSLFIGCGTKEKVIDTVEASNDIKDQAKKEGVSVNNVYEMQVPQGAGALYMGKINDMNIVISIEAGDDIFVSAYAEK